MTPAEVAEVLTKCAAFDARTIGKTDVHAWHEVLQDLPRTDALNAVSGWYREHRERIMPSDIRLGVEVIRTERLKSLPPDDELMADIDPNAHHWPAAKAARVLAWADGRPVTRAFPGGAG